MNNLSVKKQNRVLLITIAVILTAAAVLIALTGGANKKEKEENPPLNPEISTDNETKPSETTVAAQKTDWETESKPGDIRDNRL